MIVVMKLGATPAQVEHVFEKVRELGYQVHPIYGEQRTVVACVGDERGKSRLNGEGLHQSLCHVNRRVQGEPSFTESS